VSALAYIPPGIGWCPCYEPWALLVRAFFLGSGAFLIALVVVLGADLTRASKTTRMWTGCTLGTMFLVATFALLTVPHWLHREYWLHSHRLDVPATALGIAFGATALALFAWSLGASLDRFGRALHDTELAGLTYRRLPVPGRR
jgi:hypothetical protein